MEPVLAVNSLTHYFGGLRAVHNLNISLRQGVIHGLIGPNGAGKTTAFNLITGVFKPSQGNIEIFGENLVGKPSHYCAKKGIARTFQNLRLFSRLTVEENIRVVQRGQDKNLPEKYRIKQLLKLVGLENSTSNFAGDLPYGAQRRLEIARALAIQPKLLMLDEPAAGMNPSETDDLTRLIRKINEEFNITVLLIEHQMRLVMELCHEITVLSFGEVISRGTPEEIRNDAKVIEAYLGKGVNKLRGNRAKC